MAHQGFRSGGWGRASSHVVRDGDGLGLSDDSGREVVEL